MPILRVQNDFTHGELDPKLVSRTDIELYNKAAQKMRNVVVMPQGGAKRRFGTRYVATLSAASGQYIMRDFVYDDDDKYLLVFTALNIAIYKNEVFQTDITTTYAAADIASLKFSQTFNELIITHPEYEARNLKRGSSDTSWTFSVISIKKYPAYDFGDVDYSNYTFTVSNVDVGLSKTLTSSTAMFSADYNNGFFTSLGDDQSVQIGTMRLTTYGGTSTVMPGEIITKFNASVASGAGVKGNQCFIGKPAWNSSNGYATSSTFHEGRWVVGGSKDLPQTIFMSYVGDKYNFDVGTGLASDSIQIDISTSQINIIRYIVSDRTLQIFTDSAEFAIPQLDHESLTPGNISIRKQTNNGCEQIEPVVLDNQTFYIRKGGRSLMSFVFDNSSQSYQSVAVSRLAPHLIQSPIDMGERKSVSTDDADYLFLVNGTSGENPGSLITYQSVASQNVGAFTLCETDGKFKRVESVGDDVYFIIEREVNGSTVQYLEILDFDVYSDCAKNQTLSSPGKTITNLSHLEGKEVVVRGDNFYQGKYTVSSGEVTIENNVTETEVGLAFNTEIQPMPVNINTDMGSMIYLKKRTPVIYVDYYKSLGIKINGTLIPYLTFGDKDLYNAPVGKTSIYKLNNIKNSWERRQAPVITQTEPLPMTILAIGYEVV